MDGAVDSEATPYLTVALGCHLVHRGDSGPVSAPLSVHRASVRRPEGDFVELFLQSSHGLPVCLPRWGAWVPCFTWRLGCVAEGRNFCEWHAPHGRRGGDWAEEEICRMSTCCPATPASQGAPVTQMSPQGLSGYRRGWRREMASPCEVYQEPDVEGTVHLGAMSGGS